MTLRTMYHHGAMISARLLGYPRQAGGTLLYPQKANVMTKAGCVDTAQQYWTSRF